MHLSFLSVWLCCLVGFVYSNALPSTAEFAERASHDDDNGENDEIVGGTAARAGEFPYLAGLYLDGSLCGGSLIAPNLILTAAHCLHGKPESSVSEFTAMLNSTEFYGQPGSVEKTISQFIVHPDYDPDTQDNDVALLVLTSPATGVKTIALPCATSKETYAGKTAAIAGYGTTSSGGSISTKLLKANVNVLTNTVCNDQYKGGINNNKICAAAAGKDTCQGDSGGPLVVSGVLVGVTSYGMGCADPNYAGVYARVSTYVNWINSEKANL